jgi:molybdopterin-guanine dinucleotide biosynthesis protein A
MNGLVLSGGQSSRMGSDKALIDYHGLPQYAYVYDLLSNFCDAVFISSRENKYPLPTLLDDSKYENMGPIAGLLTAFDYQATDWLVLAIDYPEITAKDIEKLLVPHSKLAAVYFNPETNFFEPFIACYRKEFKPYLQAEFELGNTSMQKLLHRADIHKVLPEKLESIKSVNHNIQ